MPHNARFLYQQPKIEINNYLIVNWFSLPLQTVEKHLVSLREQSVFTFLVDCQYKVWERHTVTVNADTYEEAKQRVINLAKNHPVSMDDGEPGLEMTFETLYETEELIEPENGKEATVQVMNYAPFSERKVLYENAK